jgi:hypothetical protein
MQNGAGEQLGRIAKVAKSLAVEVREHSRFSPFNRFRIVSLPRQ